jgi:hypothetical protein
LAAVRRPGSSSKYTVRERLTVLVADDEGGAPIFIHRPEDH